MKAKSDLVSVFRHVRIRYSIPILAMVFVTLAFAQQAGDLDPTFSGDGMLIDTSAPGSAGGVAIQSDGKIVVVGGQIARRYNPDGSPDNTFGTNGTVPVGFGASSVAIQPTDGRIVVAGYAPPDCDYDYDCAFAVARLNVDGGLDNTFDGDGFVTTAIGPTAVGWSVALQPTDGKIVVAGWNQGIEGDDFAIARYNSNGSLDTTFDGDGTVTTTVCASCFNDEAFSVAIQPDGKIVAVGGGFDGTSNTRLEVVRYQPNGSLDPTFGSGGIAIQPTGLHGWFSSVAFQSDGKIVAGGFPGFPGVVRYTANGQPDTIFDGSFHATTARWRTVVALQPDGKIIYAGSHYDGANYYFAVARYQTNGLLDTAFGGGDGVSTVDFNDNSAAAVGGVAIDEQGRAVIVGESSGVFALARLILVPTSNTITVTNTNDSGPGSLRAAVTAGNTNPADETVVFNIAGCPNGVCTIVLTSGQLSVEASNTAGTLTISNPAGPQSLKVSGNNASRIFSVSSGANLTLDGITMEQGYPHDEPTGGALTNRGFTNISNSVFRNNGADWIGGAIANLAGTVIISRSEIVNNGSVNGGGIYSRDAAIQVRDSTIANNTAYYGGGIYISAFGEYTWEATLANSTISGNQAIVTPEGGGAGGGVYLENSEVPVRFINATITKNWAGYGGGFFGDGLIGASFHARNSIISENTAGGAPDITANTIIVNDQGNNIISSSSVLGPLRKNGGRTFTHALLPGSPAINAGNNCVLIENGCGDGNPALIADQRGMPRNGTVDIGAFERQNNEPALIVPFDYDGDGKSDLSVFRPNEGAWYIAQTSGGVRSQGWGLSGDKLAPADFDGDGKTDLAVFRESDSNWYIFNSATNTATTAGWGLAGDQPVPADYGGDGKADIAVYRPSEGKWYRRDSDGQVHVYAWGLVGDKPAPADFNGDGVADMTVFRPSEGKWYTINSGSGAISEGTWGVAGDMPVPGDYSGDGKADFAVYRPTNQTWYRMHTDNNSIHIITWGLAGDFPTPGDYDGDGKQDLAVFRPSNATWFIYGSTSGIYSQPFGLTGDIPTPNAFVF